MPWWGWIILVYALSGGLIWYWWMWAHTWVERDGGDVPLWRYLIRKARQEED